MEVVPVTERGLYWALQEDPHPRQSHQLAWPCRSESFQPEGCGLWPPLWPWQALQPLLGCLLWLGLLVWLQALEEEVGTHVFWGVSGGQYK